MQFNGEFKIKSTDILKKDRGLEEFGRVQKFIDSETIRLMKPYIPYRDGLLEKAVDLGTKIGSGLINQSTPYARYQYYGEIYGPNIPIFKNGILVGFYSPPKKEPTGRELQYDTSKHPLAGKLWFERMKADKKEQILKGAREAAGAK